MCNNVHPAMAGQAANGHAYESSSNANQAGVPTLKALLAAQADYSNCSKCQQIWDLLHSTNGAGGIYVTAISHLVQHWNTTTRTAGTDG